jgi:chemotaxis protein methyltransferase CheR
MTGPDFEHFARLVQQRSGLALGPDKAYLVLSRLGPLAREMGLADAPALLARLRAGAPETLTRRCVDAMATHESLFFRDATPFEQLKTHLLPELHARRTPGVPLRVWSAACSSGQEPYSLAILGREMAPLLGGRRLQILATDMSEAVLEKARAGVYSEFEVRRGLSPERLQKWFVKSGRGFEVAPELKTNVEFRRHNLLDGPASLGRFDIVFCRNVLIYFDRPDKAKVLEQIARTINPGGALVLGSAESAFGLTDAFVQSPATRGLLRLREPAETLKAG